MLIRASESDQPAIYPPFSLSLAASATTQHLSSTKPTTATSLQRALLVQPNLLLPTTAISQQQERSPVLLALLQPGRSNSPIRPLPGKMPWFMEPRQQEF